MFMYFLEPFLENLLPSLLIILFYILFIIIEIIFSIIIVLKSKKKKESIFKAISLIGLSMIIFFFIGTPNPKIDIERELNHDELVGKWELTYMSKIGKEEASKYNNYIELDKNGLCKFNSIDYNSSKYISSSCQWNLKHNIKADNSLYKNNVLTIILDSSLEKRYFYFKQQKDELILYNYYLNDWYDKIEYRREESWASPTL